MEHLLWHNTKRPHWGIKLKTPVQYIEETYSLKECNMYLTNTKYCFFRKIGISSEMKQKASKN